ncbi:hypothetical protein JM946_08195 [Steroidobacter sp. S1-65]|uniref:DUF2225 domain-containing protein n=1 Tax=Steroidobacter gossypii TaxID=2805490 RepID=A0ABS1WUS1_9GAMM|nr:hypothetical protein [Steroidobacter gossypii]MBM0104724.1 hypothetical protein [Steroidobacter gossypii]
MSDGCAHCGHSFTEPYGYFSVDFARYYSRKPLCLFSWCFQCSHITVARQPWYFRLVRMPLCKVQRTLPSSALVDLPRCEANDPEAGTFVGSHLMRMVWHCVNARVAAERGHEDHEAALHLALEKLAPREVALMIMMTVAARRLIPLEQQIQEGMYLKDLFTVGRFKQWLATCRDRQAAAGTLEMLRAYEASGTEDAGAP